MTTNILSKDIILQHTTSENIFLKFLNLSEFPKGNILSPLKKEKNPSFTLNKDGSFNCWATGLYGDAFELVAQLNGLDCKKQFPEVLEIIATEMNISLPHLSNGLTANIATNIAKDKKGINTSETNVLTDSSQGLKEPLQHSSNDIATKVAIKVAAEKAPAKLSVTVREFTELDLAYWKNLGVEKAILDKYNLKSISSYTWTGKKPIYTKKESIAFVWELDKSLKLYIPNQPEVGVKKNVLPPFPTGIFGFEQLGTEKKENLIICAGEKDVITANSKGFNAVTFGSEAGHPKNEQIEKLQSLCNNLFVCYDNDATGEKGINALVKRFPKIIPLNLPKNEEIKGYDVTDYFQKHAANDFQKIIDLAVKNKSVVDPTEEKQLTTIIHITEDYLSQNYDIRHNIIANEIEISKKNLKEWTELNENSLWIEMQKKSIKVPASTLEKILKSDYVSKFNPIIDYFENLPVWDKKTDYIKQYADYIKLAPEEDKEQYNYHFKKWCVRAVKCATIDNYFNKNAFVISDEGKGQNIGKTTWIRFLCPKNLSNYLKDDLPKDEKDAKIALTQNFIVNLDELASLSRQEINTLKSLFSTDKIKVRFPYDKKEIVVKRIANFIGSTNLSTFLHDETGSVRWLCFVADNIDRSYRENFDINNLWSQAFALSNNKDFDETITSIDMSINELRNAKFQMQSPEKDLVCRYLEIPTTTEETKILTSTEIQHYLAGFANSIKLNNIALGKALTSLKYRKIRGANTTKYAVKYKDLLD